MVIPFLSAHSRALAILIPGLLLAFAGQPARAQALVTIDDVVEAVRQHNLALRAAHAGAAAEAERPDQVRWPFPMVEAMAMPQMIAGGDIGVALMARQQIPWADRLRADREARAAAAGAVGLDADAFEREQVLMAHHSYTDLWAVQELRALVDTFRVRLRLYREVALAQYRAGRGPQQAVLNIEVESQMLAQRLEVLAEEAITQRARIFLLTGGTLEIGPADRLGAPTVHDHPDAELLALLIEAHPLVGAAEARREAEEAGARMARTLLRPDITLGATLNLSSDARRGMFGQEVFTPSVGVIVPLWRGGVRAEVREFEERARQRELETEQARLILSTEAADALAQLDRVNGRIDRYEGELLPTVEQALDASLLGYQTGAVRFLELLDAQRMAFNIETDLIEARVQKARLQARLALIVGH